MSSSAFTPTQIEVTNEVPVNVPVVTAWEDYTPSLVSSGGSNLSATSVVSCKWRREGDSVKIQGVIAKGTTGATGSNPVGITLPTGLTIDFTKAAASQAIEFKVGSIQTYGIVAASQFDEETQAFVRGTGGTFANNAIYITKPGTGSTFTASEIVANSVLFFQATIPVAEWAGSGTTTLATRAVEEYAFNTDTSNGSNTSAFGYGPSGVNVITSTPATNNIDKRVRFQTPILSTDQIIFEINTGDLWRPLTVETLSTNSRNIAVFSTHNVNQYGAGRIKQVNSTDVDVTFAKWRSTATTYDGTTGAGLWGDITPGSAKWRLRKVSGGAQVGYPVSARNIVGDTSGSVVPTGMLGEQLSQSRLAASALALTTNTATNVTATALTLTPGTWDLSGFIGINGSATSVIQIFAGISTTSATLSSQDNSTIVDGASRNLSTSDYQASLPTYRVTISSNTTYYLVVRAIFSGGGNTANVFGRIQATRIA